MQVENNTTVETDLKNEIIQRIEKLNSRQLKLVLIYILNLQPKEENK
ncbi:hypothetical protein HZF24_04450 [Sedimentibacter hydroxybenzoicus DSM 7310]|uniref:Uncharacterized protein n=1 Tax=Sedimentibacter hydroxybenzoicus DSM 7310 TaxID=1123245 RepID=A0A974GVI9_SEDHY|nr:hypothetical protein [Sedimentibacter hydroxybenzoicus]NYB73386.1 hypothetical protein [Sedimentibacter hydroxybenzoicus DSM 7310]